MQLGQCSDKVIHLAHIPDRPDERRDGLDIKPHAWRQAMAKLGKCGRVPSVGYSQADEMKTSR
jgi:hypothetical protein